jgi:hypothetical protein
MIATVTSGKRAGIVREREHGPSILVEVESGRIGGIADELREMCEKAAPPRRINRFTSNLIG